MKDQFPPTTDPASLATTDILESIQGKHIYTNVQLRQIMEEAIARHYAPILKRLEAAEKVANDLKLCLEGYLSANVRKNTPQIRNALKAARAFQSFLRSSTP
jgi:hypothetical protein